MEETIRDNRLVYVVDDDETITNLVAINLTLQGYRARQFHCGRELLEALRITSQLQSCTLYGVLLNEFELFSVSRQLGCLCHGKK